MGYVLKAVLSSAQHPEYGQITVPFPIPDEKYDRMIELLEPLEIGDALRQDCRVDELDSFYTVLNRLVGSLVNFDELDYLAKRLDSFDDGEAAQFQGMACKLGVSNIKDFINLTFCCQQATVITDFSDLDAIGRQHYMTMQGGGCRIEELERLDGRKFALDLILNHLEGRITPYGVVYDNGMKLEQLYDGRHSPCYHYQPNLLAVGLSSRQEPENTDQITWLLLPCSEQQLQRGIARSGVNIHDARIWYEDSLLPSEVEEVLKTADDDGKEEELSMATGVLAYPYIKEYLERITGIYPGRKVHLYKIENHFFGERITVAGLITGTDLIDQLRGKELGERLLLPCAMFRNGEEVFLDDVTKSDVQKALQVRVDIVKSSGHDFVDAVLGPVEETKAEHGAYELM